MSKQYKLQGYLSGILALETVITVNSIKQAQQRFTRKYEPILKGYWSIRVFQDELEVGSFDINKNVKNKVIADKVKFKEEIIRTSTLNSHLLESMSPDAIFSIFG